MVDISTRPSESAGAIRPLLAMLAVRRTGSTELPGRYSPERQVWVVETASGEVPMIEASASTFELLTKTKVQQEADDHPQALLLDLTTKTSVQMERDDTRPDVAALLELTTKTEAQLERDDR